VNAGIYGHQLTWVLAETIRSIVIDAAMSEIKVRVLD
jgi:hypothetical protein